MQGKTRVNKNWSDVDSGVFWTRKKDRSTSSSARLSRSGTFSSEFAFFGFDFASHGNILWYFWMLNNERSRALLFWTSKWKLLKNWAKSFFFPQRRTLKYTLGKKKLLKIGRKTIKCLVMLNFAAHFLCTVHCLCLPLGMCCQIFVKMTSNGNGWCVSWRQCNKFRRSWLQRTFRSRRGKQRKQPLVNAKRCCSFSYVRYTIQTINHQNKCCWLILLICCFKVYLLSVSSWYS